MSTVPQRTPAGQAPAPTTAKRAAVYVRVSTAGQEQDGTSLQTQEERCRQYAEAHGYHVAETFREVYTGTELWDRPQLTRLRDAVRRQQVDAVVAYAIDRLSRDPVHLGVLISEADHVGVAVEFVTEPLDNSPEGQLIRFVRGYAAKIEHTKIKERSIRATTNRAASGKLLARSRVTYGYRWKGDAHDRVEPDPVTAPVVQMIFRRCLEGAPLRRIAGELTAAGIPTPTGKPKWGQSAIQAILKHPAYTGRATAYRGQFPIPAETLPPLVAPDVAEAVDTRLHLNKQQAIRNARDPESALLRGGYVRCGNCGCVLVVHKAREQFYYRCNPRTVGCTGLNISARNLDAAVWAKVDGLLTHPETVAVEVAKLQQDDPTAEDTTALDRRAAALDRQRANLIRTAALLEEDDAVSALAEKIDQLTKERDQLLTERAALLKRREAWEAAGQQMRDLVAWCELVASRLKTFSWQERRLALDALGVRIEVFPKGHEQGQRYTITASVPLVGTPEADILSTSGHRSAHNTVPAVTLRWTA